MSITLKIEALKVAMAKTRQLHNFERTRKRWRELNPHNKTYPVLNEENCSFPIDLVHVGNHTYGGLKVSYFTGDEEGLFIGDYCSIARDVIFILGGEHKYCHISTFPFQAVFKNIFEATSKGPIILEDDVWIGENSLILSGVTLRRGTVVAAGSVVTKSSEPYSIIGGNPAKLIKYRFEPDVINKLININFSKLTESKIFSNIESLYTEVTKDNVDDLIQTIQK